MQKATIWISPVLFVFFCQLFVVSPAFSQFTRSVIAEPVPNNGPVYYGHERNVARSTNGVIIAAWQGLLGPGGQILTSVFDEVFGTWGVPTQISFAGDEALKVGLISDNNGGIHAAWQQREPGGDWQIWYSGYSNGTWSAPVRVDNDVLVAEECTIEVDSNGRLWVVWNTDAEADGAEWLLASHSDDTGATWSTPDTLSSPDGIINGGSTTSGRVALWSGSNGRLVATWHEDYPGREREIRVNQYDGSLWMGEVVVSDTSDTTVSRHWYPNVCMDASDDIYLLYASDNATGTVNRNLLLAQKGWSDAWQPNWTTIYSDTNGDFLTNALTIDNSGNLYAGFRNEVPGSGGLENVSFISSSDGGTTWSTLVALNRPGYDAGYLSFGGRVNGDGVDAVWRESYVAGVDDGDSTSIMYAKIDLITGISGESSIPAQFSLQQNYPNPFNPSTSISYVIDKAGAYELSVYNLLGEKIQTLRVGTLTAGEYEARWNGRDAAGRTVASGLYFYRLSNSAFSLTRKMVLMK